MKMEEKSFLKKNFSHCSRGVLLIVSLIIFFSGAILAITWGLAIVRPRLWASDFQASTCTVLGHEITSLVTCGCGGAYCQSTYPCARITVQYDVNNGKVPGSPRSSIGNIYLNEAIAMYGDNCFAKTCRQNEVANNNSITSLIAKYGLSGTTHACFYNPQNKQEVIFAFYYSMEDVYYAIGLPGALIIISLLMALLCFIQWNCSLHFQSSPVALKLVKSKVKLMRRLDTWSADLKSEIRPTKEQDVPKV